MYKLVALFAVVAVAAADPAVLAYSAGVLPYSAGVLPYGAGILPYSSLYNGYVSPYTYPYNYGVVPALRAAVATQAPNAPAVALDPINKVPLDTPEVAAAKISHLNAKAFEAAGIPVVPLDTAEVAAAKFSHLNAKALEESGIHAIKKRAIVAPLAYNAVAPVSAYPYSSWVSPYSAYPAPVYASSLGYAHGYNSFNVHPY